MPRFRLPLSKKPTLNFGALFAGTALLSACSGSSPTTARFAAQEGTSLSITSVAVDAKTTGLPDFSSSVSNNFYQLVSDAQCSVGNSTTAQATWADAFTSTDGNSFFETGNACNPGKTPIATADVEASLYNTRYVGWGPRIFVYSKDVPADLGTLTEKIPVAWCRSKDATATRGFDVVITRTGTNFEVFVAFNVDAGDLKPRTAGPFPITQTENNASRIQYQGMGLHLTILPNANDVSKHSGSVTTIVDSQLIVADLDCRTSP